MASNCSAVCPFLPHRNSPAGANHQHRGRGLCNSSTLNGNYALSLTGRQVTSASTLTNVFQANGSASFDGQSTVKISLAADTLQALATQLSWSGTYSVQANCEGQLTINSGANVTFNMVIYSIGTAAGTSILLTGNDATYAYSGSGNAQPASCSVGMLSGVYTFNATGFSLNGMAVNDAVNGAGLLQFNGAGNLATSITLVSSGSSVSEAGSMTGTYSLSNCVGSATLSDSNHTYTMSISISGSNKTAEHKRICDLLAQWQIYDQRRRARSLRAADIQPGESDVRAAFNVVSDYRRPAMTRIHVLLFLLSGLLAAPVAAQNPIGGGSCGASNLNGSYSLILSGRAISGAGTFAGSFQGVGTASFDGQGTATLTGTSNTNLAQGKPFNFTGTYTVPSNCFGTISVTSPGVVNFSLVVWNDGRNFNIIGSDANYVYSGSGGRSQPVACAKSTLLGEFLYSAKRSATCSGTTQNGAADDPVSSDSTGKVMSRPATR